MVRGVALIGALLCLVVAHASCTTLTIKNSIHDYSWDKFNNQAVISGNNLPDDNGGVGDTVQFIWTGMHNVIQVMNDSDRTYHSSWNADNLSVVTLALRSGSPVDGGTFTWDTSSNYRPGIYYFCSEGENMGVNVALAAVGDHNSANVQPFPCTQLSSSYPASCTVYEINSFQTHYDWIPYTWAVKQGDIVRFRWSNLRNVVQTNDVQYREWNNGLRSGNKDPVLDYCVPGANYGCINDPPSMGEWLWDTTGYLPGIYHFSDQDAPLDGGGNGMPALIDLRSSYTIPDGNGCNINPPEVKGDYGADTVVHEITNWVIPGGCGPYCWSPYITVAKQYEVVRFRWSGSHNVYSVDPKNNPAVPGDKSNGKLSSGKVVYCVPSANMGCVNGTTSAEFIWEIGSSTLGDYYFNGDGDPRMGAIVAVSAGVPSSNSTFVVCPSYAPAPSPGPSSSGTSGYGAASKIIPTLMTVLLLCSAAVLVN